MKPGERIALLKKLALGLANEANGDWQELALTFRQFGIKRPQGSWSDPYSWSLEALEKAPDDKLLEVYEYLFSGKSDFAPPPPVAQTPWKDGRFRLFLSHEHTIGKLMGDVKLALNGYGIDGFVAHKDIKPTKEWVQEIETALDTCDALAAFLNEQFHGSNWTDQELGICFKRRVLIVPVRMGVDPYGFIGRFQGMTATGDDPKVIAQGLFDILVSHKLTAPRMADSLVSYLEDSNTFANAKARIALLQQVPAFTPQLLERLEGSIERNSQIKGSFGVPAKIASLVRKHRKE